MRKLRSRLAGGVVNGHELKRTLRIHEKIAAVYADPRFPKPRPATGDLRMFVITAYWVIGIERAPNPWERVCEVMHLQVWRDFWWTIEQDIPRWEPPDALRSTGPCEAPMVRRDGPCGKRGCTSFRRTDPATGEWRVASYCSRHWDYSREIHQAEIAMTSAGGIPEPVPNTGGLLPCYIGWDWEDAYAKASRSRDWKPPQAGIRADDWPVLAKVSAMGPPKLAVLEGDGEPVPAGAQGVPSLRLVT